MSLITRCPSCATTFRVSPAQLSARGGRVRCGKCDAAFDGVANLLADEAAARLSEAASTAFEAPEAADEADPSPGTVSELNAPVPTSALVQAIDVPRADAADAVLQ